MATKPTVTKSKFTQGYYICVNPDKYVGDVTKIRYMSSWELQCHRFFDTNPNVLRWSSEGVAIPYVKPTTNKVHKYLVDYWIQYTKNGEIFEELVEVKPASQTRAPRKNNKHIAYEQIQYAVNTAKWKAAMAFAEKQGIKFRILTENAIFK